MVQAAEVALVRVHGVLGLHVELLVEGLGLFPAQKSLLADAGRLPELVIVAHFVAQILSTVSSRLPSLSCVNLAAA